jgi:hypothetical protein
VSGREGKSDISRYTGWSARCRSKTTWPFPPRRGCARCFHTSAVVVDTHYALWHPQHDVGSSRCRVASMGARGTVTLPTDEVRHLPVHQASRPVSRRHRTDRLGLEELSQAESARFETYEPLHGENHGPSSRSSWIPTPARTVYATHIWLRALPEETDLRYFTPCPAWGGTRASRRASSPGDNSRVPP